MRPKNDDGEPTLPALKDELQLYSGHADWTGAPSALIHDPMRNRYFRIGARAMMLLTHWRAVTPAKLIETIRMRSGEEVSIEEVQTFGEFLIANSLVTDPKPEHWRNLAGQAKAATKPLWHQMVHNYLFFRIPLFRPQRALDTGWPFVAPLFTRVFAASMAVLGLASLYLVSRQWDVFTTTFAAFLSLEGLMIYGLSLVIIKLIHELGHAFMAHKYGVEVPVIGIAFIVLMPILYTDTTGAHRLNRRGEKLNIDLAGIYAELVLAVVATTAWVFLPDGPLRSVAFSTATLSWVLSLAVNLNPFMRFDGYYVLSDAIRFENLQERGFALARWQLRELLFNLQRPLPEFIPSRMRVGIILHAWSTWIYRFFLFLGIALLVYHFFIKIIGIALFIIEICWFILLPVGRELKAWWQFRGDIIMQRRSRITLGIFLLAAGLFVAPVFNTIELPATVRVPETLPIHSRQAALIMENHLLDGRSIEAGEVLLRLSSPDLQVEQARNQMELGIVQVRLARSTADREDQSLRLVLEQELAAQRNEEAGLARLADQLVIRAPHKGILVNVDTELHEGMWISPSQRLGLLKPMLPPQVIALVAEDRVGRIREHATGTFIPDDFQFAPFPVTIERIGKASLSVLPEPMMAEPHGGPVPVLPASADTPNEPAPAGAWYPVHLRPDADLPSRFTQSVMRGVVRVEGKSESMAAMVFRRIAGVLLRESGF